MPQGDFGDKRNTNGFDKNPDNINREGRPKKIYTHIKELGYSADDLKACFGELVFYTLNDLDEIINDESKPAITRIVAKAVKKSVKSGDMREIKDILEHSIGKPTQMNEHKIVEQTPIFKDNGLSDVG